MAPGFKTGGRTKGTPNKPRPIILAPTEENRELLAMAVVMRTPKAVMLDAMLRFESIGLTLLAKAERLAETKASVGDRHAGDRRPQVHDCGRAMCRESRALRPCAAARGRIARRHDPGQGAVCGSRAGGAGGQHRMAGRGRTGARRSGGIRGAERNTAGGFGGPTAISATGAGRLGCACRKLNPAILVMQSAQDWATKNVPGAIDGARDRRIFLQG